MSITVTELSDIALALPEPTEEPHHAVDQFSVS